VIPYAVSYGLGRITSAQNDAIWIPRSGARGKRAVVLCHGQLQTTLDWLSSTLPGQMSLPTLLAGVGLVVVATDLNGPNWGHTESVADIDAIRTYVGGLGCATDKLLLVGASMGAYDALAYMATYPSRVAAMVGVIPAVDLDDIRDNNRGGTTQANINTAWGLAAGSTSSTVPLPAGANVSSPAVAAVIATSGPILLAYSTVDTTVIPATVTTFASRVGSTCTTVVADTTNGHSDASMGLAAALTSNGVNQIASFLAAAA
jgi:pimeloyl-ACP methyl ester carboxylesterase